MDEIAIRVVSWLVVVHLIYRASRAAELRDAYFLGTASAIAYGTQRRWPLAESGRGRSLAVHVLCL